MCYYNGVRVSYGDYIKILEIEKEILFFDSQRPLQNGFDYADTVVIKPIENCDWEIVKMEWGFIPHYLKNREEVKRFRYGYTDENGKFHPPKHTLNAVGEELLLPGKIYKEAALKRRCLILSTGFFEWRHVYPLGKKGQPLKTAIKYPYYITVKDKRYFFMAAVWQPWTDRETGETIETCAIVTTAANSLMEQIHNSKKRMPVILPEPLAAEWMSDTLSEERIHQLATHRFSASGMEAFTIHKDFRQAEAPDAKYNYEGLPELIL